MSEQNSMTFQDFKKKYKPVKNHLSNGDYGGLMFETYGDELEHVRKFITAKKVFTLLDGDGGLVVAAGFWRIDRLGYFVTDIAWTNDNEEFNA